MAAATDTFFLTVLESPRCPGLKMPLSGVGFESGGVAAAHAVATVGLTALPTVHENFLHGEMVAIGVLTQLILEAKIGESRKVASFFAKVGLPVHLGHLGLDIKDDAKALKEAMTAVVAFPLMERPGIVKFILRRFERNRRGGCHFE